MNKYICKSTVTVTVTTPENLFIKFFIIILYMVAQAQAAELPAQLNCFLENNNIAPTEKQHCNCHCNCNYSKKLFIKLIIILYIITLAQLKKLFYLFIFDAQ